MTILRSILATAALAFCVAGCPAPEPELAPRSLDTLTVQGSIKLPEFMKVLGACQKFDADPSMTVIWNDLLEGDGVELWRMEIYSVSTTAMADCYRSELLARGFSEAPPDASSSTGDDSTGLPGSDSGPDTDTEADASSSMSGTTG